MGLTSALGFGVVVAALAGCKTDDARRETAQREAAQREAEATRQLSLAEAAKQQAETAQEQAAQHAEAARLERARTEAPARVRVEQMGCYCAQGGSIAVTCRVTSDADVPVNVQVKAAAQTGFLGVSAAGMQTVAVDAHRQVVEQVVARLPAGSADCASATACSCDKAQVTAR